MERNDDFELYLNHMGAWERLQRPATYSLYEQTVLHFLQGKERFLFQSELMEERRITDPAELKMYGNYKQWGLKLRGTTWEPVYYCILADYYVQPDEALYDLLFAYRLRQVDLIQLDKFLDYQLKRYYNANAKVFCRFLTLVMRKHADLLDSVTLQTVQEWMSEPRESPTDPITKGETGLEDYPERPLDIDEAAAFVKLKKSTLYEKTSENSIPFHKKGNKLYFYIHELVAWIKEGKVATGKEIESRAASYILSKNARKR